MITYRAPKHVKFQRNADDSWSVAFRHNEFLFVIPIGERPAWLHPEAATAALELEISLRPREQHREP